MSKIFCTECGSPNLYEVTKPKFCSTCGFEMATAFGAKPSRPTPATTVQTRAKVRPVVEVDDNDEFGDDEPVDENEIMARAQELSGTISAGDFTGASQGALTDKGTLRGIKLGTILPKDNFTEDDSGRLVRKPSKSS